MRHAFHPSKMITKPRRLYSKIKLPAAPHNTTQYLLSNYDTQPQNFQSIYDEYNHGSMMGIVSSAKLSEEKRRDSQENGLDWVEKEMQLAKMSNDRNTMNSIINKFGDVLREQQITIRELEKQLKSKEDKKNNSQIGRAHV